jgi:hypothetical protein
VNAENKIQNLRRTCGLLLPRLLSVDLHWKIQHYL